jgi:hypothetical protein
LIAIATLTIGCGCIQDQASAQTPLQIVTGVLDKIERHPLRCGPGSGSYALFIRTVEGKAVRLGLPLRAINNEELERLLNREVTVRFDGSGVQALFSAGVTILDYEHPGAVRPMTCAALKRAAESGDHSDQVVRGQVRLARSSAGRAG